MMNSILQGKPVLNPYSAILLAASLAFVTGAGAADGTVTVDGDAASLAKDAEYMLVVAAGIRKDQEWTLAVANPKGSRIYGLDVRDGLSGLARHRERACRSRPLRDVR